MDDRTVPPSLRDFLTAHGRIAVAFSGGADSAYLLYAAKRYSADVRAYTVKSPFQTRASTERAVSLAESMGADITVIDADVLSDPLIRSNPTDRCYHCKRRIFQTIIGCASRDGYDVVADATNATDDPAGRPGMRALDELDILSPLRICGIGKKDLRMLSREAGLPTWDLPSDSCLATRIPHGTEITEALLTRTESAEEELRSLGLRDIRVRYRDGGAVLEVTDAESSVLDSNKERVEETLLKYYPAVTYSVRTPGP